MRQIARDATTIAARIMQGLPNGHEDFAARVDQPIFHGPFHQRLNRFSSSAS
jgi:hypothetical protein